MVVLDDAVTALPQHSLQQIFPISDSQSLEVVPAEAIDSRNLSKAAELWQSLPLFEARQGLSISVKALKLGRVWDFQKLSSSRK